MPGAKESHRVLSDARPVRIIRTGLEMAVAIVVFSYAMIICTQVFYRYVLNSSLIWSEELVRFGLLWGVMLGAALASDRNAHVALNPLRDRVSDSTYQVISWISGICILAFCAVTAWYGWEYAYRIRLMSSPASQISMIYVYAAIPVGSVLIAFFTLIQLVSGTFSANSAEEELLAP